MKNIILTRRELHELVWSMPMIKLSRKFAISDYGMRKVCRTMDIPLPKPGYWERLKLGKPDEKENLSDAYSGVSQVTLSLRNEESTFSNRLTRKDDIPEEVDAEFRVPEKLTNPDKLIVNMKECIEDRQNRKWDQPPKKKYEELININVSKENLSRALRFMDSFIKVMRNRGHKVYVEGGTFVILGDEKVSLYLRDLSKRIIVEEKNWTRSELIPTGKLTFIATFHWLGEISWKDGTRPIEQQMQNIVLRLEEKRFEEMERRLNIEKHWAEQREEQRIRKELEQRKSNEVAEFKKLLLKAERWQKAVDLINFLNAYENRAVENGTLTEEKVKWLEWARKKADWFDPEIELEDELMEDVDRNEFQIVKQSNINYF
jgi:hypothetical protein